MSYGYDAVGRIRSLAIPPTAAETFGYDVRGRLTSHATALGTFNYRYLGNSDQVTSRTLTNGTTTLTTTMGYLANGNDRRLSSISHSGAGRSYALTSNPYQITRIVDTASVGHPLSTQTRVFTYDGSDRLLSAMATVTGNSSYLYDRLDNVTQRVEGGVTNNLSYNNLNQLTQFSGSSWSYDANGNVVSDGRRSYLWDAEDRPTQLTMAGGSNRMSYAYDGLGRRLKGVFTGNGTTTETRFLWCGLRLCQVRDGLDNVTARVYQEGEFRTAGAQKALYLTDHLGSVRDVVDANTGALLASLDYSPYGMVQRQSGSFTPLYQFAQLLADNNIGLNLSVTRLYDPMVGRWISRDPLGEAAGINLFAYVNANPIRWADPQGECPWCIAGAAIGTAANVGAQLYRNGGDFSKIDPAEVIVAAAGGALGGGLGTVTAGLGSVANIAANTVGSGIIGGAQQIASNALHGRCLTNGAVEAAKKGAVFGGIGTALGGLFTAGVQARNFQTFNALPLSDKMFLTSNGISGLPDFRSAGVTAGNIVSNVFGSLNQ